MDSNIESDFIQFAPFHPANTNDSHISFDFMDTDVWREEGEKVLEISIDYHINNTSDATDITDIYLEEAQVRLLADKLNKFLGYK